MTLKLKNGKFYDEKNNIVKPEFGSPEQIKLLKEADEKMTLLKTGGFPLNVGVTQSVSVEASFNCVCGKIERFDRELYDVDECDALPELDGEDFTCRCGREYELSPNKKINEIFIKLIEND